MQMCIPMIDASVGYCECSKIIELLLFGLGFPLGVTWLEQLSPTEIIKIRLCYTKHKRHRVAHGVIAGPGYRHMSLVVWLKIVVKLRIAQGEVLTDKSPLLVRMKRGKAVPMTGAYMASMD